MNGHRPQDWPARLHAYCSEATGRPFEWGSHDCVHFGAGWLRRLGYPDPLTGFSEWASPLSAARVILLHGGFESAVGARMADLGCLKIPPAMARRGDLALIRSIDARRLALGIVDGACVLLPARVGIISVPLLISAVCAWRT